jgi:glyoxylase-like metal-dependent hydrolase (beta-lactamase superfamily II)
MTIKLFGCECGQFHSPGAGLGMSGERVSVPVPCYVIEHPEGVALFDCGFHADLLDPADNFRRGLNSQSLDISFTADDMVGRSLERLDIDPARVRYVVLSHLHFDHAGGLHQLPNATVVAQRREWEAGADPDESARYFLRRRFYELGHDLQLVQGEHDLFGDGSVTCLPSFGHTPGHQSLRVRSEAGEHILVGDACYHCEVVETRNFPEYSDHVAMNRSLDNLLALRDRETVLVFGHDPDQWGDRAVLPGRRD